MIESLVDKAAFNEKSKRAWARNVDFWLTGPLRHVQDVGGYIVRRVESLQRASGKKRPVLLDMGCGNAWLLQALQAAQPEVEYIGVDGNSAFINWATSKYALPNTTFVTLDFNELAAARFGADIIVNAFNFLELPDLRVPMGNAASWLNDDGILLTSTIDKTYLILALSKDWQEFHDNLTLYQQLPGVKYGFQQIDLGNGLSDTLQYPSVLYSAEDYIAAAEQHDLSLRGYKEHVFTAKAVPKIYCHFEFRKEAAKEMKGA